jgi:uncharacterized ferredoxin-like protein
MEGVETVAKLMEISARTAPKAKGQDYIATKILRREEIQKLGEEMVKYGKEKNHPSYVRDGENVKNSQSVLLIGLKNHPPLRTNCGACGFDCDSIEIGKKEKEFIGPNCVKRIVDLGIALGSAAKTASMLNVDNRIMYHAGHIARKIGLMNANLVYAVPLSVSGKNIYFDRG